MSLYADSVYPVRAAVEQIHQETLDSFARPGTWLTGAQRAWLVAQARDARIQAGLQEALHDAPALPADAGLPAVAGRIARRIAVSVTDLDRSILEEALAGGLTDAEYVEIVGVVSRAVNVDVFARGIGVPMRALPAVTAGEPSRARPQAARSEGAWVDSVPGGARGGEMAKHIYDSSAPQAAPFILRALSLVPDEARGLICLGRAQYLNIEQRFMDMEFSHNPSLSRMQLELVAARVSAINQCFY